MGTFFHPLSYNSSFKSNSSGNASSQLDAGQAQKFLGIDVTEHPTKCARAASPGLLSHWQNQHLGWWGTVRVYEKLLLYRRLSELKKIQPLCTWIHETESARKPHIL